MCNGLKPPFKKRRSTLLETALTTVSGTGISLADSSWMNGVGALTCCSPSYTHSSIPSPSKKQRPQPGDSTAGSLICHTQRGGNVRSIALLGVVLWRHIKRMKSTGNEGADATRSQITSIFFWEPNYLCLWEISCQGPGACVSE